MDPVAFIARDGGVVTRTRLLRVADRRSVDGALAEERLTRPFRGTLALPGTPRAVAAAVRYGGVVSHTSAARLWGCDLLRTS